MRAGRVRRSPRDGAPPGSAAHAAGAGSERLEADLAVADPDGRLGGAEAFCAATAAVQAAGVARLVAGEPRQPGARRAGLTAGTPIRRSGRWAWCGSTAGSRSTRPRVAAQAPAALALLGGRRRRPWGPLSACGSSSWTTRARGTATSGCARAGGAGGEVLWSEPPPAGGRRPRPPAGGGDWGPAACGRLPRAGACARSRRCPSRRQRPAGCDSRRRSGSGRRLGGRRRRLGVGAAPPPDGPPLTVADAAAWSPGGHGARRARAAVAHGRRRAGARRRRHHALVHLLLAGSPRRSAYPAPAADGRGARSTSATCGASARWPGAAVRRVTGDWLGSRGAPARRGPPAGARAGGRWDWTRCEVVPELPCSAASPARSWRRVLVPRRRHLQRRRPRRRGHGRLCRRGGHELLLVTLRCGDPRSPGAAAGRRRLAQGARAVDEHLECDAGSASSAASPSSTAAPSGMRCETSGPARPGRGEQLECGRVVRDELVREHVVARARCRAPDLDRVRALQADDHHPAAAARRAQGAVQRRGRARALDDDVVDLRRHRARVERLGLELTREVPAAVERLRDGDALGPERSGRLGDHEPYGAAARDEHRLAGR